MGSSGNVPVADAYEVLGVPRDASADDIRRAYHRLAREQHPDRSSAVPGGGPPFVQLQEAWEALRDAEARRTYDVALTADEYAQLRASALTHDVDLSEMDYAEDESGGGVWSYTCRCAARFELTEAQLADGVELLECQSCTLAIRPLYQLADEDDAGCEDER